MIKVLCVCIRIFIYENVKGYIFLKPCSWDGSVTQVRKQKDIYGVTHLQSKALERLRQTDPWGSLASPPT